MAISDITNEDNDGSARSDAAQKRARDAIDHTEDARSEKKKVASTAPSDDDGWELRQTVYLFYQPRTADRGRHCRRRQGLRPRSRHRTLVQDERRRPNSP